jgi:hypothetical protein
MILQTRLDITFIHCLSCYTRWFKYDRDYLCVNKSQFVPVIFEPPCNCKFEARPFTMSKDNIPTVNQYLFNIYFSVCYKIKFSVFISSSFLYRCTVE